MSKIVVPSNISMCDSCAFKMSRTRTERAQDPQTNTIVMAVSQAVFCTISHEQISMIVEDGTGIAFPGQFEHKVSSCSAWRRWDNKENQ